MFDTTAAARMLRARRKTVETRACSICGTSFIAPEKKMINCSPACRYRARANRKGRKARK